MAGAKRPNWQDKAVRRLEGLQYSKDFRADVAALPLDDAEKTTGAILGIIKKYRLPQECGLVIYDLAVTGKINASKAISGMSVICDDDETAGPADAPRAASYNYTVRKKFAQPGVSIFIPVGARITEVKSFIQSSWPYIEAKLPSLMTARNLKWSAGSLKPNVMRGL